MAGSKRSVADLAAGAAVLLATAAFLAYAATNTGRSSGSGTRLSARFDNVGSIGAGADVRIAGVKVGSVATTTIDPKSYQGVVNFSMQPDIKLPDDSSATISTGGLLGGSFVSLSPGGSDKLLGDGGVITITQSAANLEDLLGKFIFNVGSLADATQKSLDQKSVDQKTKPGAP